MSTYFRAGEDASGSFAPHQWTGRIDITEQIGQVRAIVASGLLGGFTLTVAGYLGCFAYVSGKDPVPALVIGSFFGLSGLFFLAYAIATASRVISYIYNGEIIIESQCMTIRNNAAGRRTTNEARGASGGSSSSANGFRLNANVVGRFHQ
jgi:hypothetical protein